MDNTNTVSEVNRELVISSDVSEVSIVLLEDKQLVEFRKSRTTPAFRLVTCITVASRRYCQA